MRPGPLLIRMLVMVTALALLVPVAAWFVWVVIVALTAVCGIALTETLLLLRVRIWAERASRIALGIDETETTRLALHTDATRPLQMIVRQAWPRLVDRPSTVLEGICNPGETLTLELPLRGIARGSAKVEHAAVAMTMFRVVEDDYRDIAWRAWARHGRLIVREYRIDREQDVVLCLDQGHRMAARVEQITRLDHAINAAVLIGYICNRMEDRVGIVSFATEVDRGLLANRGAAHLRAMTAYVTSLYAAYRSTDYLALATSLPPRLHHRTPIVMLTLLPA